MFDINKRAGACMPTVAELINELSKQNPNARVCVCGDTDVYIHAEKDGSIVSLDTESLDDCYAEMPFSKVLTNKFTNS